MFDMKGMGISAIQQCLRDVLGRESKILGHISFTFYEKKKNVSIFNKTPSSEKSK